MDKAPPSNHVDSITSSKASSGINKALNKGVIDPATAERLTERAYAVSRVVYPSKH